MYNLFNGKLKWEVAYIQDGVETLSSENSEEFSSIFLNPTDSSDLYGGWDNEFITTAELDSKQATVYTWLTNLPETLMFSIVWA